MSWYYNSRRPKKEVKKGIRAQSVRGGFGETWLGKKWYSATQNLDRYDRLTRGRSYVAQR